MVVYKYGFSGKDRKSKTLSTAKPTPTGAHAHRAYDDREPIRAFLGVLTFQLASAAASANSDETRSFDQGPGRLNHQFQLNSRTSNL